MGGQGILAGVFRMVEVASILVRNRKGLGYWPARTPRHSGAAMPIIACSQRHCWLAKLKFRIVEIQCKAPRRRAAIALGLNGRTNSRRRISMAEPWYRTTLRWGQTNLVEIDPARYDDAMVARALAQDPRPGRHRQCRRHRRLLSVRVPAASPRRQTRRPRSLRRCRARRPRRRPEGHRPHGLQPRRRGLLQGPSRTGSASISTASPIVRPTSTSPASTRPITANIFRASWKRSSSAASPTASPTIAGPACRATTSAIAGTARPVLRLCRRRAAAQPRLGQSSLPRLDPLELPAPDRDLGTQQLRHHARPAARIASGWA